MLCFNFLLFCFYENFMKSGSGPIQKKILLLLMSGVALGLSRSPKRSWKIIGETIRQWRWINKQNLYQSIKSLYRSKLIREEVGKDGKIKLVLTNKGREKALSFRIFDMKIKRPAKWDGKWRMVVFDIPETKKYKREILRMHLKNLYFFEFQKSIFVHPFDCWDEMEYIIEYYQLRKYVRFIVAESIDNELYLKVHFGLE